MRCGIIAYKFFVWIQCFLDSHFIFITVLNISLSLPFVRIAVIRAWGSWYFGPDLLHSSSLCLFHFQLHQPTYKSRRICFICITSCEFSAYFSRKYDRFLATQTNTYISFSFSPTHTKLIPTDPSYFFIGGVNILEEKTWWRHLWYFEVAFCKD